MDRLLQLINLRYLNGNQTGEDRIFTELGFQDTTSQLADDKEIAGNRSQKTELGRHQWLKPAFVLDLAWPYNPDCLLFCKSVLCMNE